MQIQHLLTGLVWEPDLLVSRNNHKLNLGPRQTSVYCALLSENVDMSDADFIS